MRELVFEWIVGDKVGSLSLVQPNGGAGSFQIILNNYYHGQVVRYKNEWLFYVNNNSEITGVEISMLREALDGGEKT